MVLRIQISGDKKFVNGLNRLQTRLPQSGYRALDTLANRTMFVAKRLVRLGRYHKRGKLERSIRKRPRKIVNKDYIVPVVADARVARYAAAVHDGTRPHIITPRNKPYLAFFHGGRWIRTKLVRHPGASKVMARPTYKFMLKAARSVEKQISKVGGKELGLAVRASMK